VKRFPIVVVAVVLFTIVLFGSGVFLWKKCIPKNIRTQTDNTLTHTHTCRAIQ